MPNLGEVSLKIKINSEDITKQVISAFGKGQKEADSHVITYKIAGDKSSLETALKQLQGMTPEILTKIKLDFNKDDYDKEMNLLKKFSGKNAKEIGEDFKASIENSLKGFSIKDIIGKDLKKNTKLTKNDIAKLKTSLQELINQTGNFDLSKATSVGEINNQVVALNKMKSILETISKHSGKESVIMDSGKFNIAAGLQSATSQIDSIMSNVGNVIKTNASQWSATLETTFNSEFNNIITLFNNLQDIINGAFKGSGAGSGIGNISDDMKNLQVEIDKTTKEIEELENKLAELQTKNKPKIETPEKLNDLRRGVGNFARNNNAYLDKDNKRYDEEYVKRFKQVVNEYMTLGGKLEDIENNLANKYIKQFDIQQILPSIPENVSQEIARITNELELLKNKRDELILQQQNLPKDGTGTGQGTGAGSGTGGQGTPTKASVSPTLSPTFKEDLQKLVDATGSVNATVSGKLSETFLGDLQTNADGVGTVKVGVDFGKKEGSQSQEIPVDVIAAPKLSETFKDDLQKVIDETGKYTITIGTSENKQTDLVPIKASVENGEEFRDQLKQTVEGTDGLDVKVKPVISDDFQLEINNAVLKDVKVEGTIQGGNLKPDSVETPVKDSPTAPSIGEVNTAPIEAIKEGLKEVKQSYEEVDKAAEKSGEQQSSSVLKVIKEITQLRKEQEELRKIAEMPIENKDLLDHYYSKRNKYNNLDKDALASEINSHYNEINRDSGESNVQKIWTTIIALVDRYKKVAGTAFNFSDENAQNELLERRKSIYEKLQKAQEKYNEVKNAEKTESTLSRNLSGKTIELGNLSKTTSEVEKLESELFKLVESVEKLKASSKTGLINIGAKKNEELKTFFEKWKEYKALGGTGNISDFTNEVKVINTVNEEYNKLIESRKSSAETIRTYFSALNPDININQFNEIFTQIETGALTAEEATEKLKAAIQALRKETEKQTTQTGTKIVPGEQKPEDSNKPLKLDGKGEINVVPKIEDPTAFTSEASKQLTGNSAEINVIPKVEDPVGFANQVTEQLKGQSATINVKQNVNLSSDNSDSAHVQEVKTTELIDSELKAKIETIKKEKALLAKIREYNDFGDYGQKDSFSEQYYNDAVNGIKSVSLSYKELLDILIKIRELEKESYNIYGQINGISSHSEEFKKLIKEMDDISAKRRDLENLIPSLDIFQGQIGNGKSIRYNTSDNDLFTLAKGLVEHFAQVKLELGQIDDISFAKLIHELPVLEQPIENVKKEAELANKELKKFGEVYRAVRSQNLEFLDRNQKNGAIWATSEKDLYNTLYTGNNKGKEYSAEYYARNPLIIDAKGASYQRVTHLGDGADEASKQITELYNEVQRLTQAREEAHKALGIESQEYIELSKQLGIAKTKYDDLSKSKSNVYGTHWTDEFVDLAKANGYDGLRIDNIYDSTKSLATSYAVWSEDQVRNIQLIASGEKELLQIHNECASAAQQAKLSIDGIGEQVQQEGQEAKANPIQIPVEANIESLNTSLQSKKDQILPVDVKINAVPITNTSTNVGTTGMTYEAEQAETLRNKIVEVTTAVDNKTNAFRQEEQVVNGTVQSEITMLEVLDGQLNIILQDIQRIIDKPLKVNVDYSSIEQLSQADENGKSSIDKLKASIDGLQTGVLSDLGKAFSGLQLPNGVSGKIGNLAKALEALKKSLSNIDSGTIGFLDSVKDLAIKAEGLKDLATVIRASKEEIQKAKEEIKSNSTSDGQKIINIPKGSEEWDRIKTKALEYKEVLGDIQKITYSMRQDKDGKQLKSYLVTGSKSSVTLGENLNKVAQKETQEYRKTAEELNKIRNDFISAANKSNISFDLSSLKVDKNGIITFTQTVEKAGQEAVTTKYQIKDLYETLEKGVPNNGKVALNKDGSLNKSYLNNNAQGSITSKDLMGEYTAKDKEALITLIQQAIEWEERENEYIKERNRLIAEGKAQEKAYYDASNKERENYTKFWENSLLKQDQKSLDGRKEDLSSIYAQADENVKRENEYLKERNKLLSEGKAQEKAYYDAVNKERGNYIKFWEKSLLKQDQDSLKLRGIDTETLDTALQKTKASMDQIFAKKQDISGFQSAFDRAQKKIKELNDNLEQGKISNIQTGYTDKVNKIIADLNNVVGVTRPLGEDPNAIKNAESMMRQYANTINNGNVKIDDFNQKTGKMLVSFEKQKGVLQEIELSWNSVTGEISATPGKIKRTQSTLTTFIDGIKARFRSLIQYLSIFVSYYRIIGMIKNGINVVKELDTALTEMRKVSDETVQSLKKFQGASFDIARSVGTTAKQIQESTADFMRLGNP